MGFELNSFCVLILYFIHYFRYGFRARIKNGPSPASFSLFSSFQYTVGSKQMFNINKFLPMTGFEPRTSGIGSDRSTNWATTTAQMSKFSASKYFVKVSNNDWNLEVFSTGRNIFKLFFQNSGFYWKRTVFTAIKHTVHLFRNFVPMKQHNHSNTVTSLMYFIQKIFSWLLTIKRN